MLSNVAVWIGFLPKQSGSGVWWARGDKTFRYRSLHFSNTRSHIQFHAREAVPKRFDSRMLLKDEIRSAKVPLCDSPRQREAACSRKGAEQVVSSLLGARMILLCQSLYYSVVVCAIECAVWVANLKPSCVKI